MEEQKQEMKLPKQENAAEGVAGAEGATEKMQMVSGMTGYEQDKKARRMLVWLIVLAVVAVAGLATTGLALALRGQDVAELEEQVAELKGDVPPEVPEGGPEDALELPEGEAPAGAPVAGFINPSIKSPSSDLEYRVYFSSSNVMANGETSTDGYKRLQISLLDGKIDSCAVEKRTETDAWASREDCTVSGLNGDVYKVIEFGAGQDNYRNMVGFIMTDGTVRYFSLYDIANSNSYNAGSVLNAGGYVVDAVDVHVRNLNVTVGGGYLSTVFVLRDGSTVLYSDEMK